MNRQEPESFVQYDAAKRRIGIAPEVALLAAFGYEEQELTSGPTKRLFKEASSRAEKLNSEKRQEEDKVWLWLPETACAALRRAVEVGAEAEEGLVMPMLSDATHEAHPAVGYADHYLQVAELAIKQLRQLEG